MLARIPDGSSVMTNISVTLAGTGIADAINDDGGGRLRVPVLAAGLHAIEQVNQQPGGHLRFAFRHFPLTAIRTRGRVS